MDGFEGAIAALQRDWIGRQRRVEDMVSASMLRRIAAMLDLDPDGFPPGTALPPHWYSLFGCESARQSEIGPDGHPLPGVFLPPIPLPRRMGAGRRVSIPGVLRAGDPLVKTAEVAAIEPKQGRTGRMAVLTMRHSYHRGADLIAVDEFDAVYREGVPKGTPSAVPPATPAPEAAAWREQVALTAPLVFRYSAVTWNAHRIHYDADYTREEEGYPATVQNGGLTMHLMLEAAVRRTAGRLVRFSARLTRPLYVGATVTLAGDGAGEAWVADADGALCGQVEMEFA